MTRKRTANAGISRISTGPANLKREFTEMVEKRKRDEADRKAEMEKK